MRSNPPQWLFVFLLTSSATVVRAATPVYPFAERDSVVDDYHGVRVADPYRWLESLDAPRTREWLRAEAGFTVQQLDALPGREALRRRLTALRTVGHTGVPWREAGRLYFEESRGTDAQPEFCVADSLGATPRVLLDPRAISADASSAVHDFTVSPDGRWIAYSVSPGGADIGETRVRSLADGRDHDRLQGTWSSVCWTIDGGGFFYMEPSASADDPATSRLGKRLFYHRVGQPQASDRLIHDWSDARWLYEMTSDDGRYAIVVIERGAISEVSILDLRDAKSPDASGPLVRLLADAEARHTPIGTIGHTLFLWTEMAAPRGRVVALNLREGAAARPRTVVAETTDVIQGATVAGNEIAVHYLHDVKSRLALFAADGRPTGDVALPGIGAVGWALNGRNSAAELWYSFASYLAPETVYRYDLLARASRAFRAPRVPFDGSSYETRQVFYRSKDGTRVPMFVTARKGLNFDGSHPTLLTAYGGYGLTTLPEYRFDLPWWLEQGGVYAVANIRGGGEYGEAWHRAGMLEHKQNSFDDFIAAAEYLVSARITTSDRLAIFGHSNGGLLVGAMITQRPDLFAVALADAGHHDMLRYQRFTVGAGWVPEFGSSDDPAQFASLRAYSPYHNVRRGTCYPATMLLTGDHDDRVVPSHSYKLAAALQAAQSCEHPILLRIASDASHSYSSGPGEIATLTDLWSFVAAHTGLRLPRSP